jgi:hypothetical protein
VVHRAIDQRNQTYDLAIANGDRLRLFRKTWGTIDGRRQEVGSNGHVVEVIAQTATGLRVRTKDGAIADVEWRRMTDTVTNRLLLGFGHALTIDAAQGITSDEHINAMPRGTAGVTAFTSYVAESRSRGATWTMISEGALYEAERHRQALGEITPITTGDLWARAAEDMSRKTYKALATDLLTAVREDREAAVDAFIGCQIRMETAQIANPKVGEEALRRARAQVITESLSRHLTGLDTAIEANAAAIQETRQGMEADRHLRALRAEAKAAQGLIDEAKAAAAPRRSASPGPGS